MNVVHLIPSLASGGAERMLSRIVSADSKYRHVVVIFKEISDESVFYKLESDNAVLVSLGYRGWRDLRLSINKFIGFLDEYSPVSIQTWMYHANLFGGIVGYLKGYGNIVWNIRSAEVSFSKMKMKTLLIVGLGALFSYLVPRSIVSCSGRAIDVHARLLYQKSKFVYIPNGIDDEYIVDSRSTVNEVPVIGFVARFDPQKNHHNFLCSLKYVDRPVKFVLIGRDVESIDLSDYDVKGCDIVLLDEANDIFSHYDAFDFLVLPSIYGEAFPNVLMEAMSRGVVCIASDVGDSFSIMSSFGYRIENPESPQSIADSINQSLRDFYENSPGYKSRSEGSISRVRSEYRLHNVVAQYGRVWSL